MYWASRGAASAGTADLGAFRRLHAGLADQGDPEAGDAVGPGWVGARHDGLLAGGAGAALPPPPNVMLCVACKAKMESPVYAYANPPLPMTEIKTN